VRVSHQVGSWPLLVIIIESMETPISKRKINPSRIFVIRGVWRQPILALE